MDYFEQLIKEIDDEITKETDKMLDLLKKIEEHKKNIEQLKTQRNVVMGLNNHVEREY